MLVDMDWASIRVLEFGRRSNGRHAQGDCSGPGRDCLYQNGVFLDVAIACMHKPLGPKHRVSTKSAGRRFFLFFMAVAGIWEQGGYCEEGTHPH